MDNNELYHYGIKGMKWGVRKKYYKSHMDNDRVLKKGTTIQNISKNEKRDLTRNTPVYGSHTENDKNAYSGYYANNITAWGDKAIKNTIELTQDVKIASQKVAVETFMDMYKKDPVGVSKSISNAYADLDWFHGIPKIRDYNAERISKKFSKKGEDWVKQKGYLMFNQSMMAENNKARNEYYKILLEKGYNAISDINDVQSGYNTEDPLIFINPKQTLKNVESRELTFDEIKLANARYHYDLAVKNRTFVNDIIYQDYKIAKKELKRIEKKQGLK